MKNLLAIITTHVQCLIETTIKLEKSNITSILLIESFINNLGEGGSGIDFANSQLKNAVSKNRIYSTLEKKSIV